jgi:Lrp/AsnC family leucine-responsive transcriptional regulator
VRDGEESSKTRQRSLFFLCPDADTWRNDLAQTMAIQERTSPAAGKSGKTRAARGAASATADDTHGPDLDRYDVAILDALQRDARLSNAELANRIGLSAAPTWRRVKWLEDQGYITGYRAEIDRRRIGLGVLAFVRVDAERNNAAATRTLEDMIRALPEVVSCHYISGAGTFELQVLATDLDAYSRWAMETLFKLPNVKDMHTRFSLGEVKAGAAWPLGHLRGAGGR